jgi:hypothetical protein
MCFHYPPVFDVGNVAISDIGDFKNVKYLLLGVSDIKTSCDAQLTPLNEPLDSHEQDAFGAMASCNPSIP